ncbi:pirin family protein [Myxosarcina sp. GI1]|uniref:pirin family protein n=1 Tax=Myxosarcina sp. GI1 TaxID=1541065 RepID=UPI0005634623|nr:pirin family protein [Myxosarcina sp. GI1]
MSSIIQLLAPHIKDLGGFNARRSLPHDERMMIGSFIFFDHLGPAVFPPGKGVDVRPHPHINLATVTYLFEGALLHRDSLGSIREIQPGAVNWMSAGSGIVHSERSPQSERNRESTLHAIQTWVALPEAEEESEPWFRHYPSADIPTWTENGVDITLIAGESKGKISPVEILSPTIYLDLVFTSKGKFMLSAECSERAIYSITPGIVVDGQQLEQHQMAVLAPDSEVEITAKSNARCMVIGGEPVGKRHKWWNFVSSRPERIERAKQDWQSGKFPQVPQETEFIPLPEEEIARPQPLS